LLDKAGCAAYLDALTEKLGSPSRMATASMFAKRYAFLSVVPALYAMTVFNKGIRFRLEHMLLDSASEPGKSWISRARLTDYEVSEPAEGSRDAWREETVKALFGGSIRTLWRVLSEVAHVPMAILWENTAVRVYSLYEKKIGAGDIPEEHGRIRDDYDYLIRKAAPALFGETYNPLARFYGQDVHAVGASAPAAARVRTTCCFYYQVAANGEFCVACPKAKRRIT